jgi:hypothetical protein
MGYSKVIGFNFARNRLHIQHEAIRVGCLLRITSGCLFAIFLKCIALRAAEFCPLLVVSILKDDLLMFQIKGCGRPSACCI